MDALSKDTTRVACLTPPGRGAIATIALRGSQVWAIVDKLFRAPLLSKSRLQPEPGRFFLGKFGDEARGGSDEVVLAVRQKDPPWLELHCHGGPEVVGLLLELCADQGAQVCSWQEFEQLADDALRALAKFDLARAPTVRTATILLDQYRGALGSEIAAVRDALLQNDLGQAVEILERLLVHAPVGRHLVEPWRVVIAGAPNVGKSTLVNALAGYQRSIVADTPGTTRDVVTTLLAIDGWPVEISDTAGWRTTAGSLEQEGINRARQAMTAADLCLWLLDGSSEPVFPGDLPASLRFVINKADLPAAWDRGRIPEAPAISARSGTGVTEMCQALSQWLVPSPPPAGAGILFTPALCTQLEQVLRCCREASIQQALQGLVQLS